MAALASLRRRPVWGCFLRTFGRTRGGQIPRFELAHQIVLGSWRPQGGSLAGCALAGIAEGRAGRDRRLSRVLVWRAGLARYLVALLIRPAVWLASGALRPAAGPAFQAPDAACLLSCAGAFVYAFFAALLVEEFGRRGFALPRLQSQYGSLLSALILGALWALWRLPSWAFFPSLTRAGTSVFSVPFAPTFLGSAGVTTAATRSYTWRFNHSRRSVPPARLLHTSAHAAGSSFQALCPALVPQPVIPVTYAINVIVVAAPVVVITGGRRGSGQYRQDTGVPAPGLGVLQPGTATPAASPAAT